MEVHNDIDHPHTKRRVSNNLSYHLKELEEEEQTKPEISRRKEIIKIREAISKIGIKKTKEKKSRPGCPLSPLLFNTYWKS